MAKGIWGKKKKGAAEAAKEDEVLTKQENPVRQEALTEQEKIANFEKTLQEEDDIEFIEALKEGEISDKEKSKRRKKDAKRNKKLQKKKAGKEDLSAVEGEVVKREKAAKRQKAQRRQNKDKKATSIQIPQEKVLLQKEVSDKNIIIMEQVSKTYESGVDALQECNLSIQKGEFIFVVGSSGSGKSTFIKLLLKEIEPTSGRIVVSGTELGKMKRRQIARYRRQLGVVFQDFRLLEDRNVYENVAFAQRIVGVSGYRIRKNVVSVLSLVGLADKLKANPKHLSGGEQQRVAIARALVNKPAILLADEPTGNLDPKNSWEIMSLLEDINKMGTTVLVVTHNNDIVDTMKKRVLVLKEGVVVSDEEKGSYHFSGGEDMR